MPVWHGTTGLDSRYSVLSFATFSVDWSRAVDPASLNPDGSRFDDQKLMKKKMQQKIFDQNYNLLMSKPSALKREHPAL
jgi:hypothetical protein